MALNPSQDLSDYPDRVTSTINGVENSQTIKCVSNLKFHRFVIASHIIGQRSTKNVQI